MEAMVIQWLRALDLAFQTCTWQWNWNPECETTGWLQSRGGGSAGLKETAVWAKLLEQGHSYVRVQGRASSTLCTQRL